MSKFLISFKNNLCTIFLISYEINLSQFGNVSQSGGISTSEFYTGFAHSIVDINNDFNQGNIYLFIYLIYNIYIKNYNNN